MKDGIYLVNKGPSLKTYLAKKAAGPALLAVAGNLGGLPKPGEPPPNFCLLADTEDGKRVWRITRELIGSDIRRGIVSLALVVGDQQQAVSYDDVNKVMDPEGHRKLLEERAQERASGPAGAIVGGNQ